MLNYWAIILCSRHYFAKDTFNGRVLVSLRHKLLAFSSITSAGGPTVGINKFFSGVAYAINYSIYRVWLWLAFMFLMVTDIAILDDHVTCRALNIFVFNSLTWRSSSKIWRSSMHRVEMLSHIAITTGILTVNTLL
jgi:hypothetical protein